MNLTQLAAANALIQEIEKCQGQLADIELALGVTFRGQYQNDEIVGLVRPVIVTHIDKKIRNAKEQLRQLGVECNK